MLTLHRFAFSFGVAVFAPAVSSQPAAASVPTTLAVFTQPEGFAPDEPPVFGPDGRLYGTLQTGGVGKSGAIYAVDPATRSTKIVYAFSGLDGVSPYAGLLPAKNGLFYGTTWYGGLSNVGTVFAFDPASGKLTQLHAFRTSDGAVPWGTLVADAAGNLYGTTRFGGAHNVGTVFRIAPATRKLTTLASFNIRNGQQPFSGLTIGPDGALYGTTAGGGAHNLGVVFRLPITGGEVAVLRSFNTDTGDGPLAGVTFDKAGNLYGVTAADGPNQSGGVYRIDAGSRTFTPLHYFVQFGGASFSTLVFDPSGNLVGTTFEGGTGQLGTIYRINPASAAFQTLFSFDGLDGNGPEGGLTVGPSGELYGTTGGGGAGSEAFGTLFELRD